MMEDAMTILGAGRVGRALARRAAARELPCRLVDREQGWDALAGERGPILVCVRNDDLDGVLGRVPPARRADLVFVQNGMIRPWLEAHGLAGSTRGLLFFAVADREADLAPGGSSRFTGPLAGDVVAWMHGIDVPAEVVTAGSFAVLELEKLAWNAAFGLLCDRFDCDVGTVVRDHSAIMRALLVELVEVGDAALGLGLSAADREAMVERDSDYAVSIPRYRGSLKEWEWRNGWFVQAAEAGGPPDPLHRELLAAVGAL